jgi:hypothetical protein
MSFSLYYNAYFDYYQLVIIVSPIGYFSFGNSLNSLSSYSLNPYSNLNCNCRILSIVKILTFQVLKILDSVHLILYNPNKFSYCFLTQKVVWMCCFSSWARLWKLIHNFRFHFHLQHNLYSSFISCNFLCACTDCTKNTHY